MYGNTAVTDDCFEKFACVVQSFWKEAVTFEGANFVTQGAWW